MVAEKAGVTETAIESANAVLKRQRDEVEAVKLGRKPLEEGDTARACMRATAPSKPSSSPSRLRPRRLPIRSTRGQRNCLGIW